MISSEQGMLFSFYNKEIEVQSNYPDGKHYFCKTFNSTNCFHIHKCIWLSNWETNPPNRLLPVAQNTHSEGTGRGLAPKVKRLTKILNRLLQTVISKLRQSLDLAKSSLELSQRIGLQRAESLCISIEEELEDILACIGRVTSHTRVEGSRKKMAKQHDSVCVNAILRVGMPNV